MCGIFGITDNKDAARLAYVGLFTLQHRGQESAGIVTDDHGALLPYTGMGLVNEVFDNGVLGELEGRNAVGHIRYSTTGSSHIKNAQPLVLNSCLGNVAVAHNGNITNADAIKAKLQKDGAIFQSSSDSEVILHLAARHKGRSLEDTLARNLPKLSGAYAFLFMTPGKVIGARDPYGYRPLVLGRLGRSYILASETCAIEVAGGSVVREIEPGEMAVIAGGKIKFKRFAPVKRFTRCIFEQVYFARPDSVAVGRSVQTARYEIGARLAGELKDVKADLVSGVPDSGTVYALGYAKESGIPYQNVFMRNHYTGRSFIQPDQKLREFTAHLKLAPIRDVIKGKTIILIDDSLVRGTTSRQIVKNLKRAGAGKIVMAIASPAIVSPCYFGIDTPTKGELIANQLSLERIRRFIGADALHYLSLESLVEACGDRRDRNFCVSCFTGKYMEKP
ncbi:MAG TPA: amidophosphoribosyltransferase [Elusimicrobia bacterium]|nr:MAG: amidophosphoribosyltransferase [Elusimicrobia bacterium GWA2_64_40]OGR63660.1 MAG: amidophosphoribosyltransferase [Elusimicrobia bacterium GWB2_63_16]HAN05755.1 amidophosphoribosyltransferase [Elusimicrobiota bacterium]HAU88847.1 amidophosphoribosyltransferase [Elusimicrobiota bacterium]